MRDDWFRNTTWNESVAATFEAKLRRARPHTRNQVLWIQAGHLARSCPEVALALIDRHFATAKPTHHASAFVVRAEALLALGRVDDAIGAYEDALGREAAFPSLRTTASMDLPMLVALRRVRTHYAPALAILGPTMPTDRLVFPRQRFQWHAAHALIAADSGEADAARVHAEHAMTAAGLEHSGLRYHPDVGLVTDRDAEIVARVRDLLAR